ncbi:MAG: tRNA (guanosine(46)-N7)-methyltransferase TrmB [Lachnospiraceae bacterium]|nr:tRNA (guanosine(46)-N7)-methyltransferase TrmB [Lachnospiraceae bacterium]
MRLRHIKGAEEMIASNRFVVQDPDRLQGEYRQMFDTLIGASSPANRPLHIEVGMGKGRFITTLAGNNPDINYIGIENHSTVLLKAVKKLEDTELNNLRFILMDAIGIEEIFAPGEVDKIYLNFSDPWPKDRHAKRRLPSRQFLARFHTILSDDGIIEFKTDNRELFDFALDELNYSEFELIAKTFDLHSDDKLNVGNIMTEYEEKFSSMGNPICKYIIKKKVTE